MSTKTYDRQSGKFVARIAENLPEISGQVMEGWIENPKALQKFLAGLAPPSELVGRLLSVTASLSVTAHQRFVMKDHLRSANIGWTGDNFKRVMLEKVEKDVPARKINIHRLEKASLDPEIMAELGSEKRVTFLAHFIKMIEKQVKGQSGPLLTDGSANIAYIPGTDGNLWTVFAHWNEFNRDWDVGAYSVEYPNRWHAGRQVLSSK